jgi:hypothetical protein
VEAVVVLITTVLVVLAVREWLLLKFLMVIPLHFQVALHRLYRLQVDSKFTP